MPVVIMINKSITHFDELKSDSNTFLRFSNNNYNIRETFTICYNRRRNCHPCRENDVKKKKKMNCYDAFPFCQRITK